MQLKTLTISNILSIEHAEIEFSDTGVVLVNGWNEDAGRANGAGKTAIFNALAFALYDEIPRNILVSEIVRRSSKVGQVSVTLDIDGHEYQIVRVRPKACSYYKDGELLKINQAEWEALLKLSYKQFITAVYSTQDSKERFITLNDTDKKSFLVELLNLDIFDRCRDSIEGELKELKKTKEDTENHFKVLGAQRDSLLNSIEERDTLVTNLGIMNATIEGANKEMESLLDVTKPDTAQYDEMEQKLQTKRDNSLVARSTLSGLYKQYSRLRVPEFSAEENCTKCGSELDITSAKAAHEQHVAEIEAEKAALKQEMDVLDAVAIQESTYNTLLKELASKRSADMSRWNNAKSRLKELNAYVTGQKARANDIQIRLDGMDAALVKFEVLDKKYWETNDKIDALSMKIELNKTLSFTYSPMGAQAYVLDSIVDMFNEKVDDYVTQIWSNFSYKLQVYKENAKGNVTAKFSESLTMDGTPVSLGSLSGGEFRALSLCVDFALVDVLSQNFGLPITCLILDEPFNGLDTVGREMVSDLLERLGQLRQIWIIDHATEFKSMFSDVVTVTKKNGISTVSRSS